MSIRTRGVGVVPGAKHRPCRRLPMMAMARPEYTGHRPCERCVPSRLVRWPPGLATLQPAFVIRRVTTPPLMHVVLARCVCNASRGRWSAGHGWSNVYSLRAHRRSVRATIWRGMNAVVSCGGTRLAAVGPLAIMAEGEQAEQLTALCGPWVSSAPGGCTVSPSKDLSIWPFAPDPCERPAAASFC